MLFGYLYSRRFRYLQCFEPVQVLITPQNSDQNSSSFHFILFISHQWSSLLLPFTNTLPSTSPPVPAPCVEGVSKGSTLPALGNAHSQSYPLSSFSSPTEVLLMQVLCLEPLFRSPSRARSVERSRRSSFLPFPPSGLIHTQQQSCLNHRFPSFPRNTNCLSIKTVYRKLHGDDQKYFACKRQKRDDLYETTPCRSFLLFLIQRAITIIDENVYDYYSPCCVSVPLWSVFSIYDNIS